MRKTGTGNFTVHQKNRGKNGGMAWYSGDSVFEGTRHLRGHGIRVFGGTRYSGGRYWGFCSTPGKKGEGIVARYSGWGARYLGGGGPVLRVLLYIIWIEYR